MNECSHPHLTHIVNIENGGEKSTTYQCQECKQLLTVAIKPLEITVSYGRPAPTSCREPSHGIRAGLPTKGS